ncbi:hypothetical protein FE257_003812 [Aspergillus nanangensis]|uniref:glutamate decarboxylase n=1 Tax=Aspergillus nanangensis TaxID=2582783 RepID=A0AAD4GNE1_ASPNN|nr:hypothetical protein FE257_003812 [Aspergillus nanangensis]
MVAASNLQKNQACVEEYSTVTRYREKCISFLSNLWGNPSEEPLGSATSGSSEAIMLAGLAMKRSWQERNGCFDRRLNVIIGSNAHACVFKFAAYFEVEPRIVPVTEKSNYVFDVDYLEETLDCQTIGVFLTLGSTFTGHYDPVAVVAGHLDDHEARTGNNIPIHVDAASGGFVAPFAPGREHIVWDFRIRRVLSINASGHKFGMSSCAVGWLIWRDRACLPSSLLVESSYLRGAQTAFSLSFSRSAAPVVVQYFKFLSLGMDGYVEKITSLLLTAGSFGRQLERTGYFTCVGPVLQSAETGKYSDSYWCNSSKCQSCSTGDKGCGLPGLPVVVFTFSAAFRHRHPYVTLTDVGDRMFERGFSIPHYLLQGSGDNGSDIEVLRIVIREDTRREVDTAYAHLMETVKDLTGT